jgi:hypothetical protein
VSEITAVRGTGTTVVKKKVESITIALTQTLLGTPTLMIKIESSAGAQKGTTVTTRMSETLIRTVSAREDPVTVRLHRPPKLTSKKG